MAVIAFLYDFIPLDIFVIIAVLNAVVFSSRYGYYKKFFKIGQEIPATITYHSYKSSFDWLDDMSIRKFTCRIRYSYTFNEQIYEGKSVIKGGNVIFSDSRKLRKGDEILILVDPDYPKRSIIRNMYMPKAWILCEKKSETKPSGLNVRKWRKNKTDI
jgi:hypothetical protein